MTIEEERDQLMELVRIQTDKLAMIRIALARIIGLTHSWVIARETEKWKHTYEEIIAVARDALRL